jgi:hypothetical protein
MRVAGSLALLAGFALSACAGGSAEAEPPERATAVAVEGEHRWGPRPGYSGPCPSPAAQGRLRALDGKPVPVGVGGVTEPGWVFGGFSVVPSKAAPGGKGPIVTLFRDGARRDLHLPDDAAVDALVRAFEEAAAGR